LGLALDIFLSSCLREPGKLQPLLIFRLILRRLFFFLVDIIPVFFHFLRILSPRLASLTVVDVDAKVGCKFVQHRLCKSFLERIIDLSAAFVFDHYEFK
jgi:hypothetical protein